MDYRRRQALIKVPNFEQFVHWLRDFAVFLTGLIVGCALFLMFVNQQIEEYHDTLTTQERVIADMRKELEAINKNRNRPTAISKVHVEIVVREGRQPLDELTKNEVERAVETKLEVFLGIPASEFARPERQRILQEIVNQKYYVRDKDYSVVLRSIVLVQNELTIGVTAEEFIKPAIWPAAPDKP
jgi:hypothetical protein